MACITLYWKLTAFHFPLLLLFLSILTPASLAGGTVQCPGQGKSSSISKTPGCISHSLLAPPSNSTVQLDRSELPRHCLAVCRALVPTSLSLLALRVAGLSLTCVCLEHPPLQKFVGPTGKAKLKSR